MSSSPCEKPSPATDSLSERHESVLRLEEDEGEDEDEESTMDSSFAANDLQSSRPVRSCKKAKLSTRGGATQKQAVDMTHQLSLGPPSNPTVRKPRKRVSGSSTCLNIGMTVENSGSDG